MTLPFPRLAINTLLFARCFTSRATKSLSSQPSVFKTVPTNTNNHDSLKKSPSIRNSRSLNKRNQLNNDPTCTTDASWSVVAYNLSQGIQIDKAHSIVDNFKEYYMYIMPQDVQEEAVVLSFKSGASVENNDQQQSSGVHDIFLFREGSIVFWGVPYEQQKRILYALSPLSIEPYSNDLIQEEKDHLTFNVIPNVEKTRLSRGNIILAVKQDERDLRLDQFAISHAIAQSVKLGMWESTLDEYIESVKWITDNMKSGKRMRLTRDDVFRYTGELFELKHRINLSSDLLDLPDVYWDRPTQEALFLSVISFLNISRRTSVMNEKLNNCCELMNLLASHINDRHHIRLEWMIIALISVEVLFEVARFV